MISVLAPCCAMCEQEPEPGEEYCAFHSELADKDVASHAMVPLTSGMDGGKWDGFQSIARKGRKVQDQSFIAAPVIDDPGFPIRQVYAQRGNGSPWVAILKEAAHQGGAVVTDFLGLTPQRFARVLSTRLQTSNRTCRWRWSVTVRTLRLDEHAVREAVIVRSNGSWAA